MREILGSKSDLLEGRLVVLGVCGSVAAVRSFDLCRELIRRGAQVHVVASHAALELVGEKLLEFASGKKVIKEITGKVEHVKFFGKKGKADLLLIAPATANTISKVAMGIDDTPITTFATTAIGAKKPVIICPAMHEPMFEHPIVQENLEKLSKMYRVKIIAPLLSEEKAKLSSLDSICIEVERALAKHTMAGKKVLVASGATQEEIDPMRIITSKASGKTGAEIAREAYRRAAQVTLIHNGFLVEPQITQIHASSFSQMRQKILEELEHGFDFFFCPASISDFSPKKSLHKIKSGKDFSLKLFANKKIIEEARKKFPNLFIVGFKAEASVPEKELEKKALDLLSKNNLQVVVANDIQKNPPGLDENSVLIVSKKKTLNVSGKKSEIARKIIDAAEKLV